MTVQEFMMKSGVPTDYKGFGLLEKLIEKVMEHPEEGVLNIVMELAEQKGIVWRVAYMEIRLAIKRGFPKMDQELKDCLFPGWDYDIPPIKIYATKVAYALKNNIL